MKRNQWGQIILGIGIGVLIGAVTSYLREPDAGKATFLLGLGLLFFGIGLSLMRRT
ncbi:hypothetical protein [Deinococcus altitudinis]|uniref:hypothetical protein n=1 Tax=Deinococcus altitudinis TaxID=468914 RepID=UPI003892C0B2